MLQTHFQNGLHMDICQGIEDILTLPAVFDQVHLLQHPQLMGDGALTQLHRLCDVRDAQLTSCKQREDMHPGRVGKALEQFCDLLEDLFFGDGLQIDTPPF